MTIIRRQRSNNYNNNNNSIRMIPLQTLLPILFLASAIVPYLIRTTTTTTNAFTIHPSYTSSSFLVRTSTIIPTRSSPSRSTTTSTSSSRYSNQNTQLGMMFDQLSSAISDIAKKLGPKQRISEKNIQPALKQVRRALLDADVNVKVSDTLIDGVRKRTLGQEIIKGVTAEQQFIKAMYDELLDIMGGSSSTNIGSSSSSSTPLSTLARSTGIDNPAIILLAGLQGAGKTTVAGKLALYLKEREVDYEAASILQQQQQESNNKQQQMMIPSSRLLKTNRKVLLIAADIYRPAAVQQLQVLGERVGVEVYAPGVNINPVDIVTQGIEYGKLNSYDTIIIDTAGRQVIDNELMNELQAIKQVTNAQETLLIVDAMTGQEAASLTAAFDTAVGITGAILTKMDGDIRGGAAVSVRGVSGKPIKFIGIGEKINDLEPFYPDRMASRILGMGDVISLVEKAAAEVSDDDAIKMQQKMIDATFDFNDFLKQSDVVSKMGSMANIAKMMPGIGNQLNMNQIRDVELRLKKNKAMINSMTKKERSNPELFITDRTARSRLLRITKGSGLPFDAGAQFISEFQKMRTMMSRMQKQMGNGMGMDVASEADIDPASAAMMTGGNRSMRRAAKKNKKGSSGGRGFGGGFA